MTDTIQHLRELMAKATPGPWASTMGFIVEAERGPHHTIASVVNCDGDTMANQRLIVAAINALPALLDVAEAASADLAAEKDAKNRALTCAADYAERAESDNREITRLSNIVADDGDRIAACRADRDKALSDLAACRAELEAYKIASQAEKPHRERAQNEQTEQGYGILGNSYLGNALDRLATVTTQRDRLAGLLRHCIPEVDDPDMDRDIAAALAELEKSK